LTDSASRLSTAVRFMLRPAEMYRSAVSTPTRAPWLRALRTPALIAVLLGVVTAIAATGRITASLVVSQTLVWSFVPALQLLTGAMVIASVRRRPVDFPRALELLFAAHGPWSVWLIVFAASQGVAVNTEVVLACAVVPIAWTAVLVTAFAREVLGVTASSARRRAFAHQAVSVTLMVIYIELATALWTRIIGVFES
jgi:hypothetical protein